MTSKKQGDDEPAAQSPPHMKYSTMRLRAGRGPAPMPHLLTIDEVAGILRTSRKAIYAAIARGSISGVVRLSRRILVDSYELQQWIDKQRVKPPPPLPLPGRRR